MYIELGLSDNTRGYIDMTQAPEVCKDLVELGLCYYETNTREQELFIDISKGFTMDVGMYDKMSNTEKIVYIKEIVDDVKKEIHKRERNTVIYTLVTSLILCIGLILI